MLASIDNAVDVVCVVMWAHRVVRRRSHIRSIASTAVQRRYSRSKVRRDNVVRVGARRLLRPPCPRATITGLRPKRERRRSRLARVVLLADAPACCSWRAAAAASGRQLAHTLGQLAPCHVRTCLILPGAGDCVAPPRRVSCGAAKLDASRRCMARVWLPTDGTLRAVVRACIAHNNPVVNPTWTQSADGQPAAT